MPSLSFILTWLHFKVTVEAFDGIGRANELANLQRPEKRLTVDTRFEGRNAFTAFATSVFASLYNLLFIDLLEHAVHQITH